jgi:hypothetical protein
MIYSQTEQKIPPYPERVSSQLLSQCVSTRLIAEVLWRFDRQVWDTFNVHHISVEPWACGVRVRGEGVRGGIVSYKDLVSILKDEAIAKSEQLGVESRGKNLWIVDSFQGAKRHSVLRIGAHLSCDCMKFKCWHNRMTDELPPLYKALEGRLFCHHTVAVKRTLSNDPLLWF